MLKSELAKAAEGFEDFIRTTSAIIPNRDYYKAGAEWILQKARQIATEPGNGAETEELAFVEQLKRLLAEKDETK